MTKIIFEINPKKNKQWIKNSLKIRYKFKRSGFDIFKGTVKEFPKLLDLSNLPESKWDKLINSIIDPFYKKISNKLEKSKKCIERNWKKIEQDYFKEVSKLFDSHPWPKGNYKAVLSVLGGYPRYLSKKEFHIPWKDYKNNIYWNFTPNKVIIHETLHFLFFDFWNKHFKGQLSRGLLWDLSEIINVIIQNKEPFISFGNNIKSIPYPAHLEQYNTLKQIFEKSKSMKEFCRKAKNFLIKFEKEKDNYETRLKNIIQPKVIYTKPKNNERNISPNIKNIFIKFNTKMYPYSWAVISQYKEISYKNLYWKDKNTCCIKVTKPLKKNKTYKINLNDEKHLGFINYEGKPLEPFTLIFTTSNQ